MGDLRQVHTKTDGLKQPIGGVGSVNKRLCTDNWTRRLIGNSKNKVPPPSFAIATQYSLSFVRSKPFFASLNSSLWCSEIAGRQRSICAGVIVIALLPANQLPEQRCIIGLSISGLATARGIIALLSRLSNSDASPHPIRAP